MIIDNERELRQLITAKRMNFIQTLLVFIVVMAVLILSLYSLVGYVEKDECSYWESAQTSYASWQVDQCHHYNIELNK